VSGRGKSFLPPSARTLAERVEEGDFDRLFAASECPGTRNRASRSTDAEPSTGGDLADSVDQDESHDAAIASGSENRNGEADEAPPNPPHPVTQRGTDRKRGRPSSLTPRIIDDIALAMRYGGSISQATSAAGVHRRTVFKWLKLGKPKADGPYAELLRRVTKVRSQRSQPSPLVGSSACSKEDANYPMAP